MLTEKLFDSRKSKFIDYSELSKEFIANENNETKLKKRKSKIFLIFSNKRKLRMTPDSLNINLNLNNTANFLKIFTLINNKEEKTNLIHCLFTKNISQAKQILFNYQQADYNFLSTSGFILDIIEKNDEIIELIINKKENINHLIKIMNLIGNGDISYDYNYIMITANLLIYSKSIDKILKKEIDHQKIINLIIRNETILSYTYLFYIYAYLFHFEIKQIENYENVLDSLIFMIANQNQKDIDILIEDIYDIFVLLSKVPKFVNKFFNNYDIIFRNGEFNWNDLLIEQKLSIISNILKNTNSNEIQLLFKKDNGNILNLVKISLQLLSKMQKNKNEIFINIDKNDLNLIMLNIKILLTITYHKDLTDLLLENKEYFNLIILIFSEIISLKDINNNKILMNFEISKINEIYNIFFKIVNNIIKNEHKLFISQIISNNLHLQIKDKFNYYIICNYINEKYY